MGRMCCIHGENKGRDLLEVVGVCGRIILIYIFGK
jgi:hypothetical protein